MIVIEIFNLIALVALGIVSSISDLKRGLIYNKVLFAFAIYAVIADIIMYCLFAHNLIVPFLLNFSIVSVLSLYLFFSHSFAGGDCKLTIVFSLLFPASFYFNYNSHSTTLFLVLGIAIALGYFYLLFTSIYAIMKQEIKITGKQIKVTLLSFVKSFFVVTLYIFIINLFFSIINENFFRVNIWIIRAVCIFVAYLVGRIEFLKKWYTILTVAIIDIVLCLTLRVVPISLNPENYLLALALLFCQITIQPNMYKTIPVSELKKGMILSTEISVIMQNSRVRGLPEISFEDLRSRLTEEEVSSIGRWSENTNVDRVTIVKKIPFAIFIFIGFLCYFILWSFSV